MVVSAKQYPENKLKICFLTADTPESTWWWQYPLEITSSSDPKHGAESACVAMYNGLYYLFWTEACYEWIHPPQIRVATSPSFTANSFTEISVNNLFGFANEVTVSETGDVIFSAIIPGTNRIEFGTFDFATNTIDTLRTCGF